MLVLTRKVGESIRIGEDIEIVITAVEQNKVRIGVRSPRNVPVYREEVYRKIQESNREAASVNTGDIDEVMSLFWKEGRPDRSGEDNS
jgi:carbon storage regulator